MKKHTILSIFCVFVLVACSNIPSTEELDKDLTKLDEQIRDCNSSVKEYSGGLLGILTKVRLETLNSSKAMLEQKKTGIKKYITLSYTIDGKKYVPPENKNVLLEDIKNDIEKVQGDLSKAEIESSKYGGGLLGVLSLTQVVSLKNTLSFLEQKRLLLKHDVPFYSSLPSSSGGSESEFKPTPGKDADKF